MTSCAIPVIAVALATPAFAQDTSNAETPASGNDIVVTATLRDSSLQDVPFSINAQTGEDLERANATTLEAASRNVAGLNIQNLGPGQSQVSIRGVSAGQVVRDQPGVKEQVGVYLDESVISLSLFTPDLDLFDLNRLETLRGPQGTLFGAGSIGGTIRYITNQPRLGTTEGVIEGNLNLVDGDSLGGQLRGVINLPIGDNAALRAVAYYSRFGGFIDALGPNRVQEDVNDGRRYGLRVALAFQPSDNLTITPRIVYQESVYDGFNRQEIFNLYANPNTTTRPPVTFDERQQYLLLDEGFRDQTLIADLTTRADLGGAVLTLVGSYINRDILVSRDASALTGSVSVDLGFPAAGVLLPSNLRDTTDLESWTGEIRLASDNDSPFQWVVGAFHSQVDRAYSQRLPTPGYDAFTDARFGAGTSAAVANGFPLQSPYNADIPYDIKQFAVFGEASYNFADMLTLTAGGRYYDFQETRQFISGGLFSNGDRNTDRTSSNGFTPRFLLSWRASDGITVNAQASRGFRLGGVNDPLNIPLCSGGAGGVDAMTYGNRPSYDDEKSWNYELGVKTQGDGFTFNAAAFYNDISNLQMTADAGSCSSRVVFNVPKAHTAGVEFELGVEPVDGLNLGLSGSILEARFDSSVTTTAGVVIAGFRDGNRLPSTPEFTLAASADYSFDLTDDTTGFFRASVQHIGSRYTQASDQEGNPRSFVSGLAFGGATGTVPTVVDLQLGDYQLVDLSAGVEWDDGLSVTVYVTNLFDENALLSFDRERGGRARLGFSTNQPRTIGLTVRKSF
ncbi:MAG: TonB-dependent receptor [Sphingomonadaceae bacterium]|nr:TonB-dependent receptor [Sphingomonadaceae bacterium]